MTRKLAAEVKVFIPFACSYPFLKKEIACYVFGIASLYTEHVLNSDELKFFSEIITEALKKTQGDFHE